MKTRVKIEGVYYTINPEKGVVVCRLRCDMNLYRNPMWEYIVHEVERKFSPYIDSRGRFKVIGIARCNKNMDSFDPELGERIAEARAKKKAFAFAARVYEEIIDFYTKNIESLNNTKEACKYAEEKEVRHLGLLIG
jgi:hypothetical protein